MAELNSQTSQKKPHIAVFTFPFGTHAAPLLSLTRRFAKFRPDATFSFFSTAKSNESTFKSNKFDNITPYNVEDGVPENYRFTGNPMEFIDLFLKSTPENLEKALKTAIEDTKMEITCVLSDAFLYFTADIAEKHGVPWVALWTAAPCTVAVHFYTDLLREKIKIGPEGLAGRENETIEFVPGLSGCCLKDVPDGILVGDMKSRFPCLLHKVGQTLPRAVGVAMNTVEEIDPIIINDLKSKSIKCLTVGPFNLTSEQSLKSDDINGCLSWLNKHEPGSVVYLSFGTVTTPRPPELSELAKGLEESGAPFLWSLKDDQITNLPEGFLERTKERGMVVPWAPQAEILQHKETGVFVTHCGWNSISEGISGGVPMYCRPFFGDQSLNGWMVSDVWGIGLRVKGGGFIKDGTASALKSLLSEKKFRENGEKFREIVKKAIGNDGSSTKNFETLLELVVPK